MERRGGRGEEGREADGRGGKWEGKDRGEEGSGGES